MSPNEAWDSHVRAGFEAVPVEDGLKDDLFRPYVERTASRGLVKWNSNEFFHHDLLPFNGKKVMVGYDDAQARFVWVREVDAATGAPGSFICKADFSGNKERYIPLSAQRAAEETRAKGRMRRIDEKILDITEELGSPYQLEHQPEIPLPPSGAAPVSVPADGVVVDMPTARPRRKQFFRDEDLCAYALDHIHELEVVQITFIRKLLSDVKERNHLKRSGIDVDRLITLVRAMPDQNRA